MSDVKGRLLSTRQLDLVMFKIDFIINRHFIYFFVHLGDVIVSAVKETFPDILSKLNQKEQKQEWFNISTIGTIGEINRLASDTAGFMTLYYKEQIQSIDMSCKITGTTVVLIMINYIG